MELLTKTFRQFLEETSIRDASGKKKTIQNVSVRMINGTIKKLPPAKSGSSSGGDGE